MSGSRWICLEQSGARVCVERIVNGCELHSVAVIATGLTWRYCRVAGERHCLNRTGSVGVRGSNPLSSTGVNIVYIASDMGKQMQRSFLFFVPSGQLAADLEQ